MFKISARADLPQDYKESLLYRWHQAIAELATHMRDEVLLPADVTEVSSGERLPLWHCPFKECTEHAPAPTGAPKTPKTSYEAGLWAHVKAKHISLIRLITVQNKLNKDRPRGTATMTLNDFDSEIHFTLFNSALAEKERGFVPMVGHSTDRRAIQHTREVFREDNIEVLMCFVCACKDVAHRGFDKFGKP